MDLYVKKLIKALIPSGLLWLTRKSLYGGDYSGWAEAVAASDGYGADVILDKVRSASLKVKNGEAVYERDSVLFDEMQYSWPLLSALLWAASLNNNSLNILDFGGSLGSSYRQNIGFLSHLGRLRWSVVEQPAFVACGRKEFTDKHLSFYGSFEDCVAAERPDTLLLLSVLQYLEEPYELLRKAAASDIKCVMIDRTPFVRGRKDRIVVQKAEPGIYAASYPARLMDIDKFRAFMREAFDEVAVFPTPEDSEPGILFRGFIFRRRPE